MAVEQRRKDVTVDDRLRLNLRPLARQHHAATDGGRQRVVSDCLSSCPRRQESAIGASNGRDQASRNGSANDNLVTLVLIAVERLARDNVVSNKLVRVGISLRVWVNTCRVERRHLDIVGSKNISGSHSGGGGQSSAQGVADDHKPAGMRSQRCRQLHGLLIVLAWLAGTLTNILFPILPT